MFKFVRSLYITGQCPPSMNPADFMFTVQYMYHYYSKIFSTVQYLKKQMGTCILYSSSSVTKVMIR